MVISNFLDAAELDLLTKTILRLNKEGDTNTNFSIFKNGGINIRVTSEKDIMCLGNLISVLISSDYPVEDSVKIYDLVKNLAKLYTKHYKKCLEYSLVKEMSRWK